MQSMCNIAHFFAITSRQKRLGYSALIGKYGSIDEDPNERLASGEGMAASRTCLARPASLRLATALLFTATLSATEGQSLL